MNTIIYVDLQCVKIQILPIFNQVSVKKLHILCFKNNAFFDILFVQKLLTFGQEFDAFSACGASLLGLTNVKYGNVKSI